MIENNSNLSSISTLVSNADGYLLPKHGGTDFSTLIDGEANFRTSEIEVYQVTF